MVFGEPSTGMTLHCKGAFLENVFFEPVTLLQSLIISWSNCGMQFLVHFSDSGAITFTRFLWPSLADLTYNPVTSVLSVSCGPAN